MPPKVLQACPKQNTQYYNYITMRKLSISTRGYIALCMILMGNVAMGQRPREVPAPNAPIDFTDLNNILLYIGGPLLFVIGFILYRRYKKQEKEKSQK